MEFRWNCGGRNWNFIFLSYVKIGHEIHTAAQVAGALLGALGLHLGFGEPDATYGSLCGLFRPTRRQGVAGVPDT